MSLQAANLIDWRARRYINAQQLIKPRRLQHTTDLSIRDARTYEGRPLVLGMEGSAVVDAGDDVVDDDADVAVGFAAAAVARCLPNFVVVLCCWPR